MFTSIRSFFSDNRTGLGMLALVAAVAVGMFFIQGCKVSDFVKVDVPRQVSEATGSGPRVTLTEAPQVMEDYLRFGERFQGEIDKSNETLGWIISATDIGLRVGAQSLPAGGMGLALLSGLGGLFLKGPGTSKEKEKSYKAGKDAAEATLIPLLVAAGITVPKGDETA